MMRQLCRLFCVSLLGLGLALPGSASREPSCLPGTPSLLPLPDSAETAPPTPFPFPVGECLRYAVSYLGVPVGEARIAVVATGLLPEEGFDRPPQPPRWVAHVVATASTNRVFSAVYTIDDRSEAWIDLESLRTLRTRTETRHGRKIMTEEVRFDWETHFVEVERTKWHKNKHYRLAFDFGPDVHDTFDAFYAMRAGFDPARSLNLPVYAARKIYGFEIRAAEAKAENLSVEGLGDSVPSLRVVPRDTVDGEKAGNGSGTIWVSDDSRRLPLRLKGWLLGEGFVLGGVRAELIEYQSGVGSILPLHRPLAGGVLTEEGRPRWDPPAALRELRRARGRESVDEKERFSDVAQIEPVLRPRAR